MANDMLANPAYIEGVRKAEEERMAREQRAALALSDMIDLVKTRDIDASTAARERAIKRLAKYPPTSTSPFVRIHPSPKGRVYIRNMAMFEGVVSGTWAGSRRQRREWERLLRKHGYETMKAFLDDVERGAFPR